MPDRARHDVNLNPTLIGVSTTDGETPVSIWADPLTHSFLAQTASEQSSTVSVTSVNDTATSTQLIAANSSRKEIEFLNNSGSILYLLKGSGTASATNCTVSLNQGDYYVTSFKGAFQGVWSADSTSSVTITEST